MSERQGKLSLDVHQHVHTLRHHPEKHPQNSKAGTPYDLKADIILRQKAFFSFKKRLQFGNLPGGRTSRVKWSSPLASLEVDPFPQNEDSGNLGEDGWAGDALETESASAEISMYRPLSAAAHSGSIVVNTYIKELRFSTF